MKYLALLIVVVAVAGCDKSSTDPADSSGYVLEGYVELKDSVGKKLSDHSGARVSILGTTLSTTTTADGQWNLPGFPIAKPFTLVFTKAGFAEERHENFTALPTPGGNVAFGLKRMYAIQTFKPSLVIRSFDDIYEGTEPQPSYKAIFSVRIPEYDTYQATAYCMIYFSKHNAIDAANPSTYEYSTFPPRQTSSTDGTAYFDVYADSLYTRGFTKGQKIYCQGYAAGYYCAGSYYTDSATSQKIFTGFSPIHSGGKSFIAPN